MASTPIEDSMSERSRHYATPSFLRSDDPLSSALRGADSVSLEDIIRLNQISMLRSSDTLSSTSFSGTAIFSDCEDSAITKSTSTYTYLGSGETAVFKNAGYASSLSGNNGSASEAEVERSGLRRNAVFAVGDWADKAMDSSPPLKGAIGAKERHLPRSKTKSKKPVVSIHYASLTSSQPGQSLEGKVHENTSSALPRALGKQYPRHRIAQRDGNFVYPARHGERQPDPPLPPLTKPMSRMRMFAVIALSSMGVLILTLAAFQAHCAGKAHLAHIKAIVFMATTCLACLTVLAMLISHRALSEALLASILVFLFGFALLVELDELL